MNIRIGVIVAFFCVVIGSTIGYAEDSLPSNPTRHSIIQLLEQTNSYELALQMMEQAMDAVRNGFDEGLPDEKKIPDEIWASLVKESKIEMDEDTFYNMIVPIYTKYLTSADIQAIAEFYKSTAGQNLLRAMPDIMRDSGRAGQEWARKAMERIIPRIQKRLEEMGYPRMALR